MPGSDQQAPRIARVVTFSTLGALSLSQHLAYRVCTAVEAADPELVAEETLCLVATATSRAVEIGLRGAAEAVPAAASALLDLPFLYREYLIGSQVLARAEPDPAPVDAAAAVFERLSRKQAFYTAHLPPGQFPGERVLGDKMNLWMGRVSPPKLPQSPAERLQALGLLPDVLTHLRLVMAFARQETSPEK